MKIRELLSDAEHWTQNTNARNCYGEPTEIKAPDACRWCLNGALAKCYEDSYGTKYKEVEKELIKRLGRPVHLPTWNDSATFEEVKAFIEDLDI